MFLAFLLLVALSVKASALGLLALLRFNGADADDWFWHARVGRFMAFYMGVALACELIGDRQLGSVALARLQELVADYREAAGTD